jgi:Tol biopolymer transport system component
VGERIAAGGPITAVTWARSTDMLAYVDAGVLYTVRPDGRARRRIPLQGIARHPVWASGGDRLAVVVRQPGSGPSGDWIWITSPDGTRRWQVPWDGRDRDIAVLGWYPDALHLFVGLAPVGGDGIREWWRIRITYRDAIRLPAPTRAAVDAVLSPNGAWVAFVAPEAGQERAYLVRHDGSGLRAVSPPAPRVAGLAWAPHSDKLGFGVFRHETQVEIYAAAVLGDARISAATYPVEFPDPAMPLSTVWAPDGRHLAYGTNTGSTIGPVWIATFAPR